MIRKFSATVYCDEDAVPQVLQTNHIGLMKKEFTDTNCHDCGGRASSIIVQAQGGYPLGLFCHTCSQRWLKEQGYEE
jgi:hypothetical protein